MRQRWMQLIGIVLVVIVVTACGAHDELVMGTGSEGGTYYPLGQEMANVWNNHMGDVNISSRSSGASVENLSLIGADEFDLGMTVNLPAQDAINGEGEFDGDTIDNVAFIGHIYPEVLQVVTREGADIESIADLEGKRVAIGPAGSGTQAATRLVLEAYGLGDGDYEAYQEDFGDAADRLQDNVIDASFGLLGLPNARIDQLQSSAGDVQLVNIGDEALQYIEENSGYSAYTIEAGSYEWLDEDVSAISAFAVLVANTNTIDDDTAYELARIMVEHADENTHPQSDHMTLDNALSGMEGLPIHPGAEQYYQEQGLLD